MLSIIENTSLEDAGAELFDFIRQPRHWVWLAGLSREPGKRPGQNPRYQRQVGSLSICASVDVTPSLRAYLRVGFRAPGLTPSKAADHLEQFLAGRLPLRPGGEWLVEVDARKWVHFFRPWTGLPLDA